MHLVLRQLPAAIFSFAVLVLGVAVVAAPANAGESSVPADYYICHANGNPAGVEDVTSWERISPNNAGTINGHVGHKNGSDIIPPIPELLSEGQNWTDYGRQVHANGCVVPRPAEPPAKTRSEPGREASCETGGGGVTTWVDVYTRPYVWSDAEQGWVLGDETGPVRTGEDFVAYSDQEYFDYCAGPKPSAETRSVPQSEASCDPAGVTAWTDVYTSEQVWNSETRTWELGEEAGPVRTDESFTPYTEAELEDHCPADEGEGDGGDDQGDEGDQGDQGDQGEEGDQGDTGESPNHGAQDDDDVDTGDDTDKVSNAGSSAPATAAVPTVVDAGLGADVPPAPYRSPMWLLALGGGIGLMGAAGLRRRATAHR